MLEKAITSLTLAATLTLAAQAAQAQTVVALTDDSRLVRVDAAAGSAGEPMAVSGLEGALVGIDQRPADGMLYGVTDTGAIVTIDLDTGAATLRSQLSEAFAAGGAAIVDFNPVADRLRLMGESGVNYRVNVDTGEVVIDGTLAYAEGGAEGEPRIVAGAYTNSFAGAETTALYTIDAATGALALQNPPNDGAQQLVGPLADATPMIQGFDILADSDGATSAWLMADGALHEVDLEAGSAERVRGVEGLGDATVIDIAILR